MKEIKKYRWGKPEKARPSPIFKKECKCKLCKTKFIASHTENLIKLDAGIYKKTEKETRKSGYLSRDNYRRDIYEQVVVYRSVCPNCGKKKTLFYERQSQRNIIYGKWKQYFRHLDFDCY